jgi:hypothetical protein
VAQTNYVISTTALSLTASGTTVGSGNTQAGSFTVLRTMVRTGLSAGELDGSSQTWTVRFILSATSGLFGSRFKIQRRNSSGVMQSESGYTTAREPISTGTYSDDVTWASGTWAANDQLALVWEGYRTSGTGNKTGTIDANGGSWVLAPTAAANFDSTGSLTAQVADVDGSGVVGRASSGSLTAQSSTISGAATVGRVASGVLSSDSSTISGIAGGVDFEATGSLQAQSSTLYGFARQLGQVIRSAQGTLTAEGTLDASGGLVVQDSTISGTVTVNRVATGSLTAQSPTLAGEVTVGRASAGALESSGATISGEATSSATPVATPSIRVIGRGRRSFVEIDGQTLEVSGFAEAERLLNRLKKAEKAQEQDRKRVTILLGKSKGPQNVGLYSAQEQVEVIEKRIDDRAEKIAQLYAMILQNLDHDDDDEEMFFL